MEGAYKIKTGKLVDFSVQQLIDCTNGKWRNANCNGGYMTNCYNYLKSYKLETWSSYPYIGKAQGCKHNAAKGVVGVRSYTAIPANNVNAIL